MTTITFDTLKYVNTLKSGGYTQEQAEAQVVAQTALLSEVQEFNRQDVATKGDIAAVKGDIAAVKSELKNDIAAVKSDIKALEDRMDAKLLLLEQRMTIKLGTMMAAVMGLGVAVIKLL